MAGRPQNLHGQDRITVDLLEDVRPSIVKISHAFSESSVFVWNQDRVTDCENQVTNNEDLHGIRVNTTAREVAFSTHKDISVLNNFVPIQAGDVSVYHLFVDQQGFVIGHPYGFDQSLTQCVIRGLSREILNNGCSVQECIQVYCTINPGNSGGSLIDSTIRLIGMHTCMQLFPNNGFSGIGFSISIDTIVRVVGQLLESRRISLPDLGVKIVGDTVNVQFRRWADNVEVQQMQIEVTLQDEVFSLI